VKELKIGVCGLGTVGSSFVNILLERSMQFGQLTGQPLSLTHVGARRENPACDLSKVKHSLDIFEVAQDPDVDILVELIGGTTTAKELVEQALSAGKHVVTANKALIAQFGEELFSLAKANGVSLRFEAAVAGGIPILKSLTEGLLANQISSISGIINGTTNFILSAMAADGSSFEEVLKEAQELGYAEADPTFDVEGIDAAHKLQIMARLAFNGAFEFGCVATTGIGHVAIEDIRNANDLGFKVKHLGIAKNRTDGVELRVQPTLVPASHPIANVDGALNAVHVQGDLVGGVLSVGAGAGGDATASSVLADVLDLAKSQSATMVPSAEPQNLKLIASEDCQSSFYVRFSAVDRAGVMSEISTVFSDLGISIEALNQKTKAPGSDTVDIVILTNEVTEGAFNQAIQKLSSLGDVVGNIVTLHAEFNL